MSCRLEVVTNHLFEAGMLFLGVQPGAQYKIGTLPLTVAHPRSHGTDTGVFHHEVVQQVPLDAPTHRSAQTTELSGYVLQLFTCRFAAGTTSTTSTTTDSVAFVVAVPTLTVL